jgi:hypothetical protein
MSGRLLAHLRQQWIGVIALVALSGGTAYALDGSNTVFSDDIVDGAVKTADIGSGQVRTQEIANGKVQGKDLAPGAGGARAWDW